MFRAFTTSLTLPCLFEANMRMQSEKFLPFIEDLAAVTGDIVPYLEREVEPMGKECEQVNIIALTQFLDIRCRIEVIGIILFR